MLEQIELVNFEKHKKLQIDFRNGINVIIGSSNVGKSSIIRGIRWVTENLSGDEFINHDSNNCSVKLLMDNHEIQKIRKNSVSKYIVDGKELIGIGKSVPDEILEIINLNEMNIRIQFEKFFLLQDSSGEVARKLNKIVDLNIIDASIKTANRKVNESDRKLLNFQEQVNQAEKKITSYNWISKFEKEIELAEKLQSELQLLENKQKYLFLLMEKMADIDKNLCNYNFLFGKEKEIREIQNQFEFYCKRLLEINNITRLMSAMKNSDFILNQFDNLLQEKDLLCGVEQIFSQLQEKQMLLENIDKFFSIEREIVDYEKIIAEIQKDQKFCPFCGQLVEVI